MFIDGTALAAAPSASRAARMDAAAPGCSFSSERAKRFSARFAPAPNVLPLSAPPPPCCPRLRPARVVSSISWPAGPSRPASRGQPTRPAGLEPLPHRRLAPAPLPVDARQRRYREDSRSQPTLDRGLGAAQELGQIGQEQYLRPVVDVTSMVVAAPAHPAASDTLALHIRRGRLVSIGVLRHTLRV